MRICLLGAQGVGKSTVLKEFEKEYNIIDGIARKEISQGAQHSENGTVEGQQRIYGSYLKALTDIEGDFISTRSVIDVLAYSKALLKKDPENKDLKKLVDVQFLTTRNWLQLNPDIVFIYIPIEFEPVDDGLRSVDVDYQRRVAQCMCEAACDLKVPLFILSGSVEQRITTLRRIIDMINKFGTHDHYVKSK